MSALDLEEAQGLTAEDVRGYASRNGITLPSIFRHLKHRDEAVTALERGEDWAMESAVLTIARRKGTTIQSLLREMNPRMRAGLPSLAAQEAHSRNGGVWIACHGELGNGGSIVFVSFDLHDNSVAIWDGEGWDNAESEMVADMPNWRFWPCDANGNKVRYPVDAKGGDAVSAKHCETCICGRRAPVQADQGAHLPADHPHRPDGAMPRGTIAWAEHIEAYGHYAAKYGRSQSAERIAERGGFSYRELVSLLGRAPTTWGAGR